MSDKMNVYQMIAAVSAELSAEGISKDRTNTQGQGYKFRGIDDVYNALSPIMSATGLVVLPRMVSRDMTEHLSAAGKPLFFVVVEAEFDFVSSHDSTKHTVKTFGEAMDSGDKATNKAMSAAYKYAAFQTFCIPTEGDNDADATTHNVAAKSKRPTESAAATQKTAEDEWKEKHLIWKRSIESGTKTAQQLINYLKTSGPVSQEREAEIRSWEAKDDDINQ